MGKFRNPFEPKQQRKRNVNRNVSDWERFIIGNLFVDFPRGMDAIMSARPIIIGDP